MKVLIVEDDLMVADLMEECLTLAEFDVCGIARSVTAAVEQIMQSTPDVAIVDMNLANGSVGTDIAAQVSPSWPFGILYASGGAASAELSDAEGVAIIAKPFSMSDMVMALRVVGDIIAAGSTSRPLPRGMRLLQRAPLEA
jgi:DNA-binding response OmpR family regulator